MTEHLDKSNRVLHFVGTTLVIMIALYSVLTLQLSYIKFIPLAGYSFAWVGHFFFEQNRPATFKYPVWSLMSDFIMYFDTINGSLDSKIEKAVKIYK